ncbi:MAG: hypothetical protein ACPHDN_06145, partial [Candidatus Puniceispirillaceae bacterium]
MRQKPPANIDLDEDQILWQRVTQRVTPLPGRQQRRSPPPMFKQLAKAVKPAAKTPQNMPTPALPSSPTAKTPSPVD